MKTLIAIIISSLAITGAMAKTTPKAIAKATGGTACTTNCTPVQNQYPTWWANYSGQDLRNALVGQDLLTWGTDFSKADMTGATKLASAKLVAPHSDFFNTNLCNSSFLVYGDFHSSQFSHAYMGNTVAMYANLSGSSFFDINMTNASFYGADLTGAKFYHVNLSGVKMDTLPDGSLTLAGVPVSKNPEFIDTWSDTVVPGVRMHLVKHTTKLGWVWAKLTTEQLTLE